MMLRYGRGFFLAALLHIVLNASPACAQITNGGFETGDLTGWGTSGNGSVQVLASTQFSPLPVPQGNFYALVGNGPGDVGIDGLPDNGTLTSVPFTVVSDGMNVQYDLDFLTAEFTGQQADSDRLDFYTVSLIPQAGTLILLETGDVSLNGFTLIDNGSAVSAPDGTSVIDHVGFHTSSFLITPGTYSLQFSISDAGDGSFDSALLIDNVRLAPVSPVLVPEPGYALTLAAGATLLVALTVARYGATKRRGR